MLRFYAVPAWQLLKESKEAKDSSRPPEPELRPTAGEPSEQAAALRLIEYRDTPALDRAQRLLTQENPAVYARSPNDLPALLRAADQLLAAAHRDAGERAQLWRCTCGTRYAVPVSLMRPLSLKCERCGSTVELDPDRSVGESRIADPKQASLNTVRVALSEFFREAMARGWPVLVAKA